MAVEDFTTYTETDPNNHLTVSATLIDGNGVTAQEDAYVYKDLGAGHFATTFEHLMEGTGQAASENASRCSIWGVSNTVDDVGYWYTNTLDGLAVQFYRGGYTIRFFNTKTPGYDESIANAWAYGSKRYFTVERTSATSAQCRIYTDAARTALFDTLVMSIVSGTTYRYIFGLVTTNGAGSNTISLDSENLDLQEAGAFVDLAGVLAAVSAMSGTASAFKGLAGVMAGTSTMAGVASALVGLSGTMAGVSALSGSASAILALTGTMPGASALSGTLTDFVNLGGQLDAESVLSAAMSAQVGLAGSCDGEATLTGSMGVTRELAGTLAARSTMGVPFGGLEFAPKRAAIRKRQHRDVWD